MRVRNRCRERGKNLGEDAIGIQQLLCAVMVIAQNEWICLSADRPSGVNCVNTQSSCKQATRANGQNRKLLSGDINI